MADGTLDILGRKPQTIGRAYSSDTFQIAVAGQDHDFMLVQSMNFNYSQNVTRLFDLENADFQAYVASRPQGQMTLANVVTNLTSMIEFMQTYGDVCTADTNKNIMLEVQGRAADKGLCRVEGGSISFAQPVLISTAMSIAVSDYVINNNMAFLFASAKHAGRTAGTTN